MFTRRTALSGVLALAHLAVAVTAGKGGGTKPPPPPPDPAILYNVWDADLPGADKQVWVMNEDGTNQTQLISRATHGVVGMAANWAPDNRRFAFCGWDSTVYGTTDNWHIYLADLDTTNGIKAINVRSLYRNPKYGQVAGNPSWSPDGEGLLSQHRPSLLTGLKPDGNVPTRDDFLDVLINGRKDKGMPTAAKMGVDYVHFDGLYRYLKGRSDGQLHGGRPARRES